VSSAAEERQVAVITGAASGIGKATCRQLVGEGYAVIGMNMDQVGLDALVEELQCSGYSADVTDAAAIESAVG
jgi:NADP-dependent 3-hydroxy acid dehydrogenase YdfG